MSKFALLAHDLVRTLGTRRVLDGVSLTAAPGQRIGLIGENGTGKSTLLRLLAGADEPDAGTVVRPPELGFLHQEMPFEPAATIAAVFDGALREAREDLAELDRLSGALADTPQDAPEYADLLAAYGDRLDRAQASDAWDADRRAEMVLAGLGLGALPRERPIASLSGGQRSRVALAALLVRRPTALLLDEPTNHLDDDAAAFLEEQLRGLPGVVVVASHDRAFLDAVCTDLIDLDPALDGPTRYGGNYTDYQAAKRAERERWQRRFIEEQEELAELHRSVEVTAHEVAPGRARRDNEKMGYGHTAGRVQNQISRRVRNAARRLDELEREQVGQPPEPLRFRVTTLASTAADGILVSLRDIRVPGRLALDRLDVPATDRLLITGPNGTGKSTLLAVLAGRLHATGELRRRRNLRVGLLAQDTLFDRPGRTARETYEVALGAERAESVPLLSLGLLGSADLDRPVGQLSVGQRRRLALALLVADPPQLLLLDEPTNHLSPRLCDELEEALATGPGAIAVASHDRWLRSRWPGRELRLSPQRG
ncbi:ATP-binding cassette domain-containing protein [Micromonospora sp. NBC_01655]|uniref:ABC-F family ATP-binding cassette domain-containing protein n=1 Tax=Micromonospora sp. NBC_01655 TaxID=2975983 RepID=UPI00225C1371|nr:ABC-F family ATP-binding cassette domain-containing protein [Micromonospora sp. NBC_01655]MCX4471504.1 ATP-binding cassette domain-containing protein [Micromonospora sp. NBC_01655]